MQIQGDSFQNKRRWRCLLGILFLACSVRSFAQRPRRDLTPQQALGLSEQIGHVSDVSWDMDQGYPQFVLIQDIHNHPEAQSRIAAMIVYGYRYWGVRKVFLEGAFTPVDLSVFHRIPDALRNALLRRLVGQGDLSGPELAAVILMEAEWSNPRVEPFQLIGLEVPKLYSENLAVYEQIQRRRFAAQQALSEVRRLDASLALRPSNPIRQQLTRIDDLIRLKLTPAEYADYCRDHFATPSLPALDPVRELAERFYSLVEARSDAFLEQAERRIPAGSGPRILVVGGFHTARMAARLRQTGRSFVVIAPHITHAGDEAVYERRMLESISALQITQPFAAETRVKK